jgi:alpha-L-fucosidase
MALPPPPHPGVFGPAERHSRRSLALVALGALLGGGTASASAPGAQGRIALPTTAQREWQDLEVGMFVHFAPNTWEGKEYDDLKTPLSAIDPHQLDTDEWAAVAESFGARYVVLVAKHVGGFCLWPTETSDYSIRSTPWRDGRGDVVGDLARSCRKRGLGFGVYLSPADRKHGAGLGGRCATPAAQKAYDALYRRQLEEVLSRYGPVVEVWFDGSLVVAVGDILEKWAPRAMVFQGPHATIRWVGNEDGFAPYPAWNSIGREDAATGIATALHGDPHGDVWLPDEVDVSLRRPSWFWSPTNQANLLSLGQLLEIYYRSVGRGAQLLLNVTPDPTGRIPAADRHRLEAFGREVRRRFGRSIAETAGSGDTVTLELPRARFLDHVILMEDLEGGERVRRFEVEARTGGNWVPIARGTAIGHERILPIPRARLSAVRLRVLESVGAPRLRRLAVFDTGSLPPPTWDAPTRVWAEDDVGRVATGAFTLDVTRAADEARSYRLRFVAEGGEPLALEAVGVRLDGVAQPGLLRPEPDDAGSFLLTLPSLGRKVELVGRLLSPGAAILLLQKAEGVNH